VGARVVRLHLDRSALSHHWTAVPDRGVRAYYNGGGVFIDPGRFSDAVQVLGTFDDGRAAGVRCQVGEGVAVLWSVHPEHDLSPPFEPAYDEREEGSPDRLESNRDALVRATLSILGLTVADAPIPVPRIKAQFLVSSEPYRTVALADKIAAAFDRDDRKGGLLKDARDTFRFVRNDDGISGALANVSLEEEDDDDSADNETRTKSIVVCSDGLPDRNTLPLFDLASFFDELESARRRRRRLRKQAAEQPSGGVPIFDTVLYGEVVTSTQTMLDKSVRSIPAHHVCLSDQVFTPRLFFPPGTRDFSPRSQKDSYWSRLTRSPVAAGVATHGFRQLAASSSPSSSDSPRRSPAGSSLSNTSSHS
jgi:biotin--protein ligase